MVRLRSEPRQHLESILWATASGGKTEALRKEWICLWFSGRSKCRAGSWTGSRPPNCTVLLAELTCYKHFQHRSVMLEASAANLLLSACSSVPAQGGWLQEPLTSHKAAQLPPACHLLSSAPWGKKNAAGSLQLLAVGGRLWSLVLHTSFTQHCAGRKKRQFMLCMVQTVE